MSDGSKQDWDLVDHWFTYHTPTAAQVDALHVLREKAREFAHLILDKVPTSADRSAALRKLRECVMTANAAIVLDRPDSRAAIPDGRPRR